MSDSFVSKMYIDTRLKTVDSASNSDFRFQLNRSAYMPVGSTFCIDEVNIPYAWNTIETNINDKLYIGWHLTIPDQLAFTVLTVPSKRYSGQELADQLQVQLSVVANGSWTVVYDATRNNMIFSANLAAFKIFTDEDLAVSTGFVGIDKKNPESINDILQISGRSDDMINKYLLPFKTGFLNLLNYQDLYLPSANLGNFEVLGVRGEGSVIRKICVNAGWGYSIIDRLSWDSDKMSCSKLALSTLDFQLRDVKGRIVPLHGAHISFTIKFTN